MKKKRLITAAVVAIIVLFALLYTRPMTLAQMAPEVRWENCRDISINAQEGTDTRYDLQLSPGDEGFDELLALLQTHTFRRSLLSLVPINGTKTHAVRPGDFQWDVFVLCGDSGVVIDNFFGTVTVRSVSTGREWRVATADKDTFLLTVFGLIKNNPGVTTSR